MLQLDIIDIDNFIEKRKSNGPIEKTNYISSVLKNQRITQKLTLHEATENICSEAFLSKVERNLMDPRNERVELLCERFNLNYNELIKLENNNVIENLLILFFKGDLNGILAISSCTCTNAYIAQDELIKSYQYFIRKDYKKLQLTINKLDAIKQCLSDLEIFALILIVYEYNFITLQYVKARRYLNALIIFNIDNVECNKFVKECKFIFACKTKAETALLAFEDIRDNMLYYNYDKNVLFTMYYFEYLGSDKLLDYINQINRQALSNQFVIDEITYSEAQAYLDINDFDKAFEIIRNYVSKSVRFVTLFAYGIVKKMMMKKAKKEVTNKLYIDTDEFKNLKKELLNLIKNSKQEHNDIFHVAFLRLMQYEIDQSEEEVIANYIKNYLLKELEQCSYPLYNEYIIDRYCELLGNLCRYKDAFNFLLKIKNKKIK